MPEGVKTLERTYWADAEQQVTFDKVSRLEPSAPIPLKFDSPSPGKVVWQPDGPRTFTYLIESTVTGAVIPSWSLPRGKISRDSTETIADPPERFRAIRALWKDAKRNRYLVDYQYDMPPPSSDGTLISLELYWSGDWAPAHTITGDTIARPIDRDFFDPDRYRVTHLFDYQRDGTPSAVDVRGHAVKMGAIFGFPVVALLGWAVYALRELSRRGRPEPVDERIVREILTRESPEVVETEWTGFAVTPGIERFLRDLERQRKVGLRIEPPENEDDVAKVAIRLLVAREKLTPYERAGIDALIPQGMETTSEEIARQHAGRAFDPTEALWAPLEQIAKASDPKEPPSWSNAMLWLLFAAGVGLLASETFRDNREPAFLFAAIGAGVVLLNIWPSNAVRRAVRLSPRPVVSLLIPIVLAAVAMGFIHLFAEHPAGMRASAGLSLVLLATVLILLLRSATRETPEMLLRRRELVRAREWLREGPHRAQDLAPWAVALGLKRERPTLEDEEWGDALMTYGD